MPRKDDFHVVSHATAKSLRKLTRNADLLSAHLRDFVMSEPECSEDIQSLVSSRAASVLSKVYAPDEQFTLDESLELLAEYQFVSATLQLMFAAGMSYGYAKLDSELCNRFKQSFAELSEGDSEDMDDSE